MTTELTEAAEYVSGVAAEIVSQLPGASYVVLVFDDNDIAFDSMVLKDKEGVTALLKMLTRRLQIPEQHSER